MKLAELIGRALEDEGLGVRGLARQSGVSPGQLSRILSGKTRRPSVETLARLAKALERDLGALLVAAEPSELSGERLAAARAQLLDAIGRLAPDDREALRAEHQELRRQVDQVGRLAAEINALETRIVELQSDPAHEVGDREVELLREQLNERRGQLDGLDREFAGAVRAAAGRLFSEVRGWEAGEPDQLSLTLHRARHRAAVESSTAPQPTQSPDRHLRRLLRIWDQLDSTRRQRVFEYAEDQLRLSLYESHTRKGPRE